MATKSFFGKRFESVFEFHEAFSTEKRCLRFLEKKLWPNGPVSPFDPESKVYKRSDGQYRCKNTSKNFNVKVGTIFQDTKMPLKNWFYAIYEIETCTKGISSMLLAKKLNITQDTAWHILHKIRVCLGYTGGKLEGNVELDETFVGGKNKFRHRDYKMVKHADRNHADKVPVLGLVQRGTNGNKKVCCHTLDNVSGKQITRYVIKDVKRDVTLYTDDYKGYGTIHKVYKHNVITHSKGLYAIGDNYTNTIEGFWSNYCKRAIVGVYNHVSQHHMQRYFDEFAWRYNANNSKVSISERFDMFFDNIKHPITHKELEKGNGKRRTQTLRQISAQQRAQIAAQANANGTAASPTTQQTKAA